ncbi:B12-binding domain-containing radical SAM protein [candidate division CSSED10-310 bacterium]|uniref:B12-binding domain-containing radical SAM protein n=1 Tax=candidate division CSSED10-310 bacterium TaxID=2855610 RepID=A0ABV6YSX3_UNCC1
MRKLIFVQREIEDKPGVMALCTYLKSHGFSAEIILEPYKNIRKIKNIKPDFIGFYVVSSAVNWTLDLCRYLKKQLPDMSTILGGPHPTFYPNVIEQDGCDIICIGEGEKALVHLMQSYDGTLSSIENTPNFWLKKNGTIIKNSLSPLLTKEELSALPPCDRSHYLKHAGIRKSPLRRVITSRGCPYSCSYCFNSRYKELYKGLGTMVRQRSVDNVMEELKEVKKLGTKAIDFNDDQFLLSRDWILEFCEEYRKFINIPFVCGSTANRITHEIVATLKSAGCRSINFGIESGVERIRKEIYNKPTSNDHIYNAADVLHAHNMRFLTYNMIGLPEENLEHVFQTVRINQEIKTDYPWCSIVQPYPGTDIAGSMLKGEINPQVKFSYSYFQSSVIGDPEKQKIVSNSQKLFAHFVKHNTDFDSFARLVQSHSVKIHFYPLIFYWHYGLGVRQRFSYTWLGLFRYWLYTRS